MRAEAKAVCGAFAKRARRCGQAQAEYVQDFSGAVGAFLAFHPTYADLAERLGTAVQPPGGEGPQADAPVPGLPSEAVLEPAGRAGAILTKLKTLCEQSSLDPESGWYGKALAALAT